MKNFWFIIFLACSIVIHSQSNIDIIRASNYYSKAVDAYDSGKFEDAFQFLNQAEMNLKGKTNNDLVFLKIMTQYKLKDYDAAYNLMLQFFNGDFKRNRMFFKNIKTYRIRHNINYDQFLTEKFLDIEDKYNLLKGINTKLSAEAIALRILTQKKELVPFIRRATNTKDISLSFRLLSDNGTEKKYRTETLYFDIETRIQDNTVVLNGSKKGTEFMVICDYKEESSVNKEAYYYTFTHNKCQATRLELGFTDNIGGQQEKGLFDLSSKKFCLNKKEVNSVSFTKEEKEFLQKDNNFKKLEIELQKNGLLLK